jgi:putative membrane protein
MDIDLLLTIAHHILVFSLVAIVVAEIAAIRPNMTAEQIVHLGRLDAALGAVAGLVVVVGFSRVFWGAKGPDFFLRNPIFWAKIAAFALVAIISIYPTLRILGWRRTLKANPTFSPPAAEVFRLQRFFIAEVILVPFILVFAATMVRGYGL